MQSVNGSFKILRMALLKAAGGGHDSAARGGKTPNDVITGGETLTQSQSGFTLEMCPESAPLLKTAHKEGILVLGCRVQESHTQPRP